MTAIPPLPLHHITCRICHADLLPILSLGEQYLSDFPASAGTKAYPAVPLDLTRCSNMSCGLVQLAHTTPKEWLYGGTYWYRSGVNESMRAELKDVVDKAVARVDLRRGDIVVDIGANDGTLLSNFSNLPVVRVAYEPAKNLYQHLRPHADVLIPDFFRVEADHAISSGVSALTGNQRQDSTEQRQALAGDSGGAEGTGAHRSDQGQDSGNRQGELGAQLLEAVYGGVPKAAIGDTQGAEGIPRISTKTESVNATGVGDSASASGASQKRDALQTVAGGGTTECQPDVPALQAADDAVGGRPHQAVGVVPGIAVPRGERPWPLSPLSSGCGLAGEGAGPKAKLIFSIAMFYDLEDPHQFVGDVANLLARSGVWIIQQAYLPDMLDASGYDNIGHEHLEYYALGPLEALLAGHGLEVFHVEHRAINGGSFRTYVGWKGVHPTTQAVDKMRLLEVPLLMHAAAIWAKFSVTVSARIEELREGLAMLHNIGQTVDVYGASTKGATLLQTCGIDVRTIRQAWERSPEKYGRYYSVTGIPIVPEAEGRADPPAALLVLPWSFKESFVGREAAYLAAGGKLIFPLPTVDVVSGVQG